MRKNLPHRPKLLVLWTLLLGLFAAAVLPAGTMAARTADGSWVIELCTPAGVTRVALLADGTILPAPDDPATPQSMPDCAWASAHAVSATLPLPDWSLNQPDQTSAAHLKPVATPQYAAPVPRLIQPRAPPSLVI